LDFAVIVIMRPSYGLTKKDERSYHRHTGAAIAVGIVLLTQNVVVYAVLAFVSLVFAFALIQQNYKFCRIDHHNFIVLV
jgi:hypothetical protein